MLKNLLRFFNRLITMMIMLVLVSALLYAGYALWDNHQVYASAENVMSELSPKSEKDNTIITNISEEAEYEYAETFRKLQEINPDIGAWITMPNTGIDYPVVQGETNFNYLSTDPYGNFAIVGSIFLDYRNDPEYQDVYSLLYGHNMTEHRMFSDVNNFKEESFFFENQTGKLFLPNRMCPLQTLSIIVTNGSNSWIFNPKSWTNLTSDEMVIHIKENALFVSEDGMNALQYKIDTKKEIHILALSTCSDEFTDARTILLTLMDPDEVPEGAGEEASTEVSEEAPEETAEETPEEVPVEAQEAER